MRERRQSCSLLLLLLVPILWVGVCTEVYICSLLLPLLPRWFNIHKRPVERPRGLSQSVSQPRIPRTDLGQTRPNEKRSSTLLFLSLSLFSSQRAKRKCNKNEIRHQSLPTTFAKKQTSEINICIRSNSHLENASHFTLKLCITMSPHYLPMAFCFKHYSNSAKDI